jgi:WD40 repeat protein
MASGRLHFLHFVGKPHGIARTLAFSSTDEHLLVGHDGGQIYAWDWRRQQRITVLEGHSAPIKCLLISRDGTRVVSSSDDGTVKTQHLLLHPRLQNVIREEEPVETQPRRRVPPALGALWLRWHLEEQLGTRR